ncbi:MAG TPA: HipA domain-containing protein, partial [Sphingomonas sp.]|nr:HipA domain-containing protein [Sphingomonas sp.]
TRIRALEIIQNEAPGHASVADAIIDDGMGEFHIPVSSIRQRFLEAFRLRSEHAASIDEGMRGAIATRLIEEYGSPHGAADAIRALARENDWFREGEAAERYLVHRPTIQPVRNQAALDFTVAWHGRPLGHLTHDGFEWRWIANETDGPPLIRQTTPGLLPPFILALLPEGWLERVLRDQDERALLRSGRRYMSNIIIVEDAAEIGALPQDALETRLAQYTRDGAFTGRYDGPGRAELEQSFERNLAQLFASADMPRLSGVQIKAPMFLDADGSLSPATGKAFTHILKPAGTGGYENLPLVEWFTMEMGRAAGFEAPATALAPMPDGMPPALIVERFDIRQGADDRRMIALEDMCSVLDLPTAAKYDGTMERVARAVRPLSTAPEADLLIVLRRAVFAWLMADGDMHLKNMALLKIAEPGDRHFRSVRMAPLYDAVTTRVFPALQHDRMALKLNGNDDRLSRADFRALATNAGLRASDADSVIAEIGDDLGRAADRIVLPPLIEPESGARVMIDEAHALCRARIAQLT